MFFNFISNWIALTETNIVVTLFNAVLFILTTRGVLGFLKRRGKTKQMDKLDIIKSNKNLIDENKNLTTKLKMVENKVKSYSYIKDSEDKLARGIRELTTIGKNIAKLKCEWNTTHVVDNKYYENIHGILVRPEYSRPNEFKYRNGEMIDLLIEWHSRFSMDVKWGEEFSLSYMLALMDQIREIQDVIFSKEDSDSEWM